MVEDPRDSHEVRGGMLDVNVEAEVGGGRDDRRDARQASPPTAEASSACFSLSSISSPVDRHSKFILKQKHPVAQTPCSGGGGGQRDLDLVLGQGDLTAVSCRRWGSLRRKGGRGTSFWPRTGWGFHLRSSTVRSRRRSSTARSWRRRREGGGGGQRLDHGGGARRRDRRSAENGRGPGELGGESEEEVDGGNAPTTVSREGGGRVSDGVRVWREREGGGFGEREGDGLGSSLGNSGHEKEWSREAKMGG
ncbi:uncharacterized protein A4U43_UnF470 [Asparagus officinalis]|uniref:Uncharacterized protein n=1 Tax=Asparagus officinalis TaxID=4686 RepID=A0A1R3L7R6_ASPOF|nr:uncharacterized protein A4U43_UnF470 [Asparagus officinalis]